MHTLELGILQKVIPAALQGLMGITPGKQGARVVQARSAFSGTSRPAQCKAATLAYRRWAHSTRVPSGSRVKQITPRWVQGLYPEISTEHAKAAALRAMLPWVAAVAMQHSRDVPSPTAELQATCLEELAALDSTYARQPRFLQASQEERAKEHCRTALQALVALVELHPGGPWKLIPKCHALHHICEDSAMCNPRVAHCYQDEDFIGLMKRTYIKCHGATAPVQSVKRYAMGRCIELTAREQLLTGEREAKAAKACGGPLRGHSALAAAPRSSRDAGPLAAPSGTAPGTKRGRGRPPKLTVKRPVGRPKKRPQA